MKANIETTRQKILTEIKHAFFIVLGKNPSSLSDKTSMQNLPDWNSSTHLTLLLELEKIFGVRFSPEEMASMSSIGSITLVLLKRQGLIS
ncbi:MAG: hypothetical protein A3K03_12380 [Bdellovibrionales bacterium RIFOXYD1_FULL_44_7]|nr:MAG: hypothetical protein A3K03_12380 [Bdellovibrionales bacterium RIFOXYD1_FULL_44_7]